MNENVQDVPKLDMADWNKAEKAFDKLCSSAFILTCVLQDDELITHSTRKFDEDSSAFCAQKKNLKFGDWPPEAMQ